MSAHKPETTEPCSDGAAASWHGAQRRLMASLRCCVSASDGRRGTEHRGRRNNHLSVCWVIADYTTNPWFVPRCWSRLTTAQDTMTGDEWNRWCCPQRWTSQQTDR